MIKKFESICKMSQKNLKKYVVGVLKETYTDVTVGDGFVFAKGTFPVLLVAHLDTVHKKLPNVIVYDANQDSMFSPNGIGGDDRCGVYMILEIIQHYNCSVLFCEDEEIGGVGAKKFIQTDLANELEFNYAIELDRKGDKDAVFYDCDNEEFEKFITEDFYRTACGSFSDISVVAPFLGCAAVNLSCGYYNAHSVEEYVVLGEMEKSIEEVYKILEKTTETDKFEYIERQYHGFRGVYSYKGSGINTNGWYGSGWYNSGWAEEEEEEEDENYYLIEFYDNATGKTNWYETWAMSEAEAVGRFLMWYPDLCYHNIIDILVDKTH